MKLNLKALHKSGHAPRFHPNGVIQLAINDSTLLQVYAPDDLPPMVDKPQIHEHRYGFTCRVLFGALHHTVYEVTMDPNGDHKMFEVFVDEGADKKPPALVGACSIDPDETDLFMQNASFQFPKRRFHTIYTRGLTVAVIEKGPDEEGYNPKVVIPASQGEPTPASVADQVPVTLLWEIIHNTCAMLVDDGVIEPDEDDDETE